MRRSRGLSRNKDGSCIKAATDDVIIILKAENQRELYAKINATCDLLSTGAEQVGLSFTNHKALLLLPKDMVSVCADRLPSGIGIRSNTFENLNCVLEFVGAPVGSLIFVLLLSTKLWTRCCCTVRHSSSYTRKLPPSYLRTVCVLRPLTWRKFVIQTSP